VLTEYEAIKICDAAYEYFEEVFGWSPFSGEKITIQAYGYDGEENRPSYAGRASSADQKIYLVYDRLSERNSILTSIQIDDEWHQNSIPNFGLVFHELWHLFTPSEFRNINPCTRGA
jgi:hypothetical protein